MSNTMTAHAHGQLDAAAACALTPLGADVFVDAAFDGRAVLPGSGGP